MNIRDNSGQLFEWKGGQIKISFADGTAYYLSPAILKNALDYRFSNPELFGFKLGGTVCLDPEKAAEVAPQSPKVGLP